MSEEGEEDQSFSSGDPPQDHPPPPAAAASPPLNLSDPSPPNLTPDLSSVRTSTPEDPASSAAGPLDPNATIQDQSRIRDPEDPGQHTNPTHDLDPDSDRQPLL